MKRVYFYALAANKVLFILDNFPNFQKDPNQLITKGLDDGLAELIEYFVYGSEIFREIIPEEMNTKNSLILVFKKMFSGEFRPSFNYYFKILSHLRKWTFNPTGELSLSDKEISKLKKLCRTIQQVENNIA